MKPNTIELDNLGEAIYPISVTCIVCLGKMKVIKSIDAEYHNDIIILTCPSCKAEAAIYITT